jgi:serine protease AprX
MMSGTSMSAPQVAAAAAVVLQEHPRWTPDEVKWLLVRTSWPVGGSAVGSLDLARAVAFAGRPRSANRDVTQATFGLRPSTESLRHLRDEEMPDGSPTFDASSWNASSWNASSWNASSWNASSWNASSWNASSWNASSWN